ncbi:MAG TPA: NADP-specific glutamate dehydrogenase, partial [Solirubrobacterales bacterium]|nr:NADP-specific glutamate dehydrogenase [Solirubrobacterales bacterium]
SNMPLTSEASRLLREERFLVGPAKAANAGGVAVSGFEQSQNAARIQISEEDVDRLLRDVMERVHGECIGRGERDDGSIDYVKGANLAGFSRVCEAMVAQGAV